MAFVMAFYIIMTTPRFPVMLKQLVGFTDSDVSLRLKTVADQAAASSNVASLVPLRIRRSTFGGVGGEENCKNAIETGLWDSYMRKINS